MKPMPHYWTLVACVWTLASVANCHEVDNEQDAQPKPTPDSDDRDDDSVQAHKLPTHLEGVVEDLSVRENESLEEVPEGPKSETASDTEEVEEASTEDSFSTSGEPPAIQETEEPLIDLEEEEMVSTQRQRGEWGVRDDEPQDSEHAGTTSDETVHLREPPHPDEGDLGSEQWPGETDAAIKQQERVREQVNLLYEKPKMGLDQLKQLLADIDEEYEDDRTLLDVFGAAAKEYLTQKVIPHTDVGCRWDWRSVRCEPACECDFVYKAGDYHLGRSCRLRNDVDEECVVIDPARLWRDKPATRRLLSLVGQTAQIVSGKMKVVLKAALRQPALYLAKLKAEKCTELWSIHRELETCLPADQAPAPTFPQRILCGLGLDDFPICPEEEDPVPPKVWTGI